MIRIINYYWGGVESAATSDVAGLCVGVVTSVNITALSCHHRAGSTRAIQLVANNHVGFASHMFLRRNCNLYALYFE